MDQSILWITAGQEEWNAQRLFVSQAIATFVGLGAAAWRMETAHCADQFIELSQMTQIPGKSR